jgi:Helicase conserved C-terminal domain/Orsellinic acid/F9775 biosynthesis cluster protein D/DEAD/DEAH box helicase
MNITWRLTPDQPHTDTPLEQQLSKNNADDIFWYHSDSKVLICIEHADGVQNISTHLSQKHSFKLARRLAIIQKYAQYERPFPHQVSLPPPEAPPIAALGHPLIGFLCDEYDCEFISINVSVIRHHCNKAHGWTSSKDDASYWHRVPVQTFFQNAASRRYFIVREEREESRPTLSSHVQEEIQHIKSEWSAARAVYENELEKLDADIIKQDRTGWFNRTDWPQHLRKRHLRYLAHASRLPDREEQVLHEVVRVSDLLMNRAVAGLFTFDIELRRWIKSSQQGEPDRRPIARLQNPDSQDRYTGYLRRFACYVFRVWASEQELSASQQEISGISTSATHGQASRSARSSLESSSDDDDDDNDDEEEEEEEEEENDTNEESNDETSEEEETTLVSNGSQHRPANQVVDPMQDARELFPWYGQQKALVAELYDLLVNTDGSITDEARTGKMAEVYRSFIFHKVGGKQFSSGLIHFLAVLGIDEDNNRLRHAVDYSYMLAGMVYNIRVLGAELLLPVAEREQQIDDLEGREEFLEQRRRFLADGTGTPMSIMISLLAYGKYVAMNTGNTGSVTWSRDRQTLYFRGQPVTLTGFRQMIHSALDFAEQMLWEKLLWSTRQSDRFEVDLDAIVDDVTFTKRGIWFVSKSSNGLSGGLDWTLTQMVTKLRGRERLRVRGYWRASPIRRYLRQVERFLTLLLFCVHTTGGQPARGTEVLSVRFRNGGFQDRNIFIMDGQVVVITRYHKSQALFDTPKIIPRFLPRRVGQLLVVYLAYLQPFREHLLVQVQGHGWSDHVWHNHQGPSETSRLTQVIADRTTRRLGHRYTTLDYRHIAVTIGRVVVGDRFAAGYMEEIGEVEEAEEDEESGLELQNGRGEAMGAARYGVPINIIHNLSVRSLETFRPLSERWHQFLGLASTSTSAPSAGKRAAPEGLDVAVPRKRPSWRSLFDTASQLAASTGPTLSIPGPSLQVSLLSSPPSATDVVASEPVHQEHIEQAMHQLFGSGPVHFNSPEQEEGLHAVLRSETPLVVVLPTGGGKTLLAMLPALLDPEGLTIVVVPFRALADDMVTRFCDAGIDCLEWTYGEANPATVVIVSADVAVSFGFLNYARTMEQKGLLRRIFIDECHLTFTSSDWRPKLASLRQLRGLGCPMICLTATLPPMLVFELEEMMLIRNARLIRCSTIRPRHRYSVQRCRPGELMAQALLICQRRVAHLGRQKGVIYCLSRASCEALAQELGSPYYHAGRVDRAEQLKQWCEGGGMIVATSALGTGVDFPGIVFVLHVDMPWSMIDFAQESGRGGRGGEVVDSMVLVEEQSVEERVQGGELSLDRSAMAAFVTSVGCRRRVMSQHMDGYGLARSCGEVDGCVPCDRCGEGLGELEDRQRQQGREWEVVRGALDEMSAGCAVCWFMVGDGWEGEHSLMECRRHGSVTEGHIDELRKG